MNANLPHASLHFYTIHHLLCSECVLVGTKTAWQRLAESQVAQTGAPLPPRMILVSTHFWSLNMCTVWATGATLSLKRIHKDGPWSHQDIACPPAGKMKSVHLGGILCRQLCECSRSYFPFPPPSPPKGETGLGREIFLIQHQVNCDWGLNQEDFKLCEFETGC